MSNITPVGLARTAYEKVSFYREPSSIESFLSELAIEFGGMSEIEAYEEIVARKSAFVQALIKVQGQAHQEGKFCPYEIISEQNLVLGYAVPRPNDTQELRRIREVAPLHQSMINNLQSIPPERFERFCEKVLRLMGARESFTTSISRDEGVDFVARVPFQPNSLLSGDFKTFEEEFEVLVLGQAKAYSPGNPVGVSAIRELVGTSAIFRFDRIGSILPAYTGTEVALEYRLCDPLISLIMTTGMFSATARAAARKYGVIAKDGSQISTFLCVKGVGIQMNCGTQEPSREALCDWIDS